MKEYVPPKEPAEGKIGWDETWDLRLIPHDKFKSEWARRTSLSRKIFSGGHEHKEGAGNSKLTVARLQRARREWLAGVSIASIAKDEGIHYTTLYRALYGKTWKKRFKTPKSVR